MPFVAYLGEERVVSLDLEHEEWSELRKSPDYGRLVLACGVKAISKTSNRGTQFFAHHRTAGCDLEHLGETQQHLSMKRAVAEHINTLPGWTAMLEYANEDRSWIADVMATHEDGRRAAFEVQLSSQSVEKWDGRSQKYFDTLIMPVWVSPLRHHFEGHRIPVLNVPFRKSSPLPENPADLMELETTSWMDGPDTLGESITAVLSNRTPWTKGTPRTQQAKLDAERRERELEGQRREAAKKRIEAQVEANNRNAVAPFQLFPPAVVYSAPELPFFGWAAVTKCWKCRDHMLLWFASGKNELALRQQVGQKRFENHPGVHRAINAWVRESKPLMPKANIKLLTYGGNPPQSSFVCPKCDNVQGQGFVSTLRPEKWSQIVVPTGFESRLK